MRITNNTQVRIGAINHLIKLIGSLDRKFYSHQQDSNPISEENTFSRFYTKENALWFYGARQKEHWETRRGNMDKNWNGSTLNAQLESFRQFIVDGKPICIFSRYWGYSFDSLIKIHEEAKELGICSTADFILHDYSTNTNREYKGK